VRDKGGRRKVEEGSEEIMNLILGDLNDFSILYFSCPSSFSLFDLHSSIFFTNALSISISDQSPNPHRLFLNICSQHRLFIHPTMGKIIPQISTNASANTPPV
jgi:hypothetical protein